MAYVRQRGNQLAIVHGVREPETGKVEQNILFTIYSKAEALETLGRRGNDGEYRFKSLLEDQYPDIRFNWKKIFAGISDNLDILPDLYEYKEERLQKTFRKDLLSFIRQIILADPQNLISSANLIKEYKNELEYLSELIDWRIKRCDQQESEWTKDNPFYWRFSLQGSQVPMEAEEQAAEYYNNHEYDKAETIFRLLIDCFDNYAEGYNYLGLIAYEQDLLDDAAALFEKTIGVGRKLFPKLIAKKLYWRDLSTRPYMRGLRNYTMTLNELGRYEEALAFCDRLDNECGDDCSAAAYRASIYLNTHQWQLAFDSANYLHKVWASENFTAAYASYELGNHSTAVERFLHAALNHPRTVKMLVGKGLPEPKTNEEITDHNEFVSLRRNLHDFWNDQSRSSKRFFRDFIKHPRVKDLLKEVEVVVKRWHEQHQSEEREAFNRMMLMRTFEFARSESKAILISKSSGGLING